MFKDINSNGLLIICSPFLLRFGATPGPHFPLRCGQCLVCGSDLSYSLQRLCENHGKAQSVAMRKPELCCVTLTIVALNFIKTGDKNICPTTLQGFVEIHEILDVKTI